MLQQRARVPLLIASDLEGGTALRLTGGTAFPSNMGVGATGRDQDAYAMGRITALEGRAVGIHFAFAPVADINSNPANPIINTRSFGSDPRAVAGLVVGGDPRPAGQRDARDGEALSRVTATSRSILTWRCRVLDVPWAGSTRSNWCRSGAPSRRA